MLEGWEERAEHAIRRYEDGAARLPDDRDERQRQLTRMGNAAWAAGLSYLMCGRQGEATIWLVHAAARYRESWPLAPPGSWGRPIGAMKALLLARDGDEARVAATRALEAGATESESPIGRYAGALASLILGDDTAAAALGASLRDRDDFPQLVAVPLAAIATSDGAAYAPAIRELLADFEAREEFLEDIPVADTVLALQALAEDRGLEVDLVSPLLPP